MEGSVLGGAPSTSKPFIVDGAKGESAIEPRFHTGLTQTEPQRQHYRQRAQCCHVTVAHDIIVGERRESLGIGEVVCLNHILETSPLI